MSIMEAFFSGDGQWIIALTTLADGEARVVRDSAKPLGVPALILFFLSAKRDAV